MLDLDITNYADDNTPHLTNKNLNKILHDPEKEPNILFKWFTENLSETNPEKKHLLTNSTKEIRMEISNLMEWPSPTVDVKNFWVTILITS